jgi:hypothetical protein
MSRNVRSVRLESSVRALALTCQAAKPRLTRRHSRSAKALFVSMALSKAQERSVHIKYTFDATAHVIGSTKLRLIRLQL